MSVQRDNFDPLDDLLASAQWPSENEGSVQRLRSAYVRASHQRGWMIWRPIAAAAVIVIGWAVAWSTLRDRRVEVAQVTPPAAMRAGPSVIAAASVDPLAGRPPTQLELAMMRVQEKRGVIAPAPSRESLAAKEARLAAAVAAAGIDVSLSAVREFCGVATARQLPLVLRLSRDPRVRPATVEAVGRLADAQTTAQLARQDVSSHDRRKLCAALIARGSNDAVTRYLELIADPRLQQDALASIDSVESAPTEQLMKALRAPRADIRIAAALALGRTDGPVVTQRLIRLIHADPGCREAFIALASSRGVQARAFMKQAATSERFFSQAQSAIAQAQVY